MANNKVELKDGTVLVDMGNANLSPDGVLKGYSGYGANGELVHGTAHEATAFVDGETLYVAGGLISGGDS